ncbi:MAG: glutathione S-transferase family protein [bacterium]|nr:glutathione S-transferase family protein [bacterium]
MFGSLVLVVVAAGVVWWAWENAHRKTHPVAAGHHAGIELPHEQEFELYHNALSLCSKKARVCLAELGLPYKSHPIDLIETGSYENLSRQFLSVNPAGTVPVLVHEGHPIYESHEQIRYAADHAPSGSPVLVPDDPELRDEMQTWVDCSSIIGDPIAESDKSAGNAVPGLTLPLFSSMITEIPYTKILEGLLFHIDRRRPLIFLAFKARGLDRLPDLGPLMKINARARRHMHEHLDRLEAQLVKRGGPWILGDLYSLADVSWMVIFDRLVEADAVHVFLGDGKRPAVSAYWERLQKRPSYSDAIEGHRHPTVARATARLRERKHAIPALRAALED